MRLLCLVIYKSCVLEISFEIVPLFLERCVIQLKLLRQIMDICFELLGYVALFLFEPILRRFDFNSDITS